MEQDPIYRLDIAAIIGKVLVYCFALLVSVYNYVDWTF